jgi:hypothetical protein
VFISAFSIYTRYPLYPLSFRKDDVSDGDKEKSVAVLVHVGLVCFPQVIEAPRQNGGELEATRLQTNNFHVLLPAPIVRVSRESARFGPPPWYSRAVSCVARVRPLPSCWLR